MTPHDPVPGVFADRREAGRLLGGRLEREDLGPAVVLGLPRGGVPVAAEVARSLGAPLDVIVVRKVGVPFHPEVAMGAIAEGGARFVDERLMARLGIGEPEFARLEVRERVTLDERVARIRARHPAPTLTGRIAVVVDDGIATGATAIAASIAARDRGASLVVVAAPVVSTDAVPRIARHADRVIGVLEPDDLGAVGVYYLRFDPTSDAEVDALLEGRDV